MIWSSAQPANVKMMCEKVFTAADRAVLTAVWARDKLDLSPKDYYEKVQVFKRLNKIWDDMDFQMDHPEFSGGVTWSQANTVLVDDSVLKASAQPHNLVEIPEFTKEMLAQEESGPVLARVIEYLEQARKWDNVSAFIRKHPFRFGESRQLDASDAPVMQVLDQDT